jgi:hypothetical protein
VATGGSTAVVGGLARSRPVVHKRVLVAGGSNLLGCTTGVAPQVQEEAGGPPSWWWWLVVIFI